MPAPPSRRRRSSSISPRKVGFVRSVPLLVGVVIAGLILGAGVPIVIQHVQTPLVGGSVASPSPTPSDVVVVGPTPTVTAIPSPSPSVSPLATSATPSVAASVARESAMGSPSPAATSSSTPIATAAPSMPAVIPTLAAQPTLHPATPSARPSPPPPPLAPRAKSTGIAGDVAVAVVRRYLEALASGNDGVAYGLLGLSAGDQRPPLSERALLTRDAQVGAPRVLRVDAGGVRIQTDVSARGATYTLTFRVVNGDAGPYISERDHIKN
jgi:hypothetical protein